MSTSNITTIKNQPEHSGDFITGYQLDKVMHMFSSESEYKKHMNNLTRTVHGLRVLWEKHPELEHIIKPQFDTLNRLRAALCPVHPSLYPYPPYHDIDINGEPLGF